MGMSLRDAVARAGSFDALLPHLKFLKAPFITARAAGFYTVDGTPKKRADDRIPAWWWEELRDVDPAAGWARFAAGGVVVASTSDDEIIVDETLAIGIELEQAAVEALIAPASAPRHAGGRPTEHKWEGAAQHVDRWVADRGPLQKKARAVELMTEWFGANDPPPPIEQNIYRWIQEHPQRCQGWLD